jgi:hypothetical protein
MVVIVRFDLLRALDHAPAWSKKKNIGVCRLAPRWDVKLVHGDGSVECMTATYRNSGQNRDAFVLDDVRILKLAPVKGVLDQNILEAGTHEEIRHAANFKCVPAVFGSGYVCVEGHKYSWIIVERALWTLSDFMLHWKAFANTGDDMQPGASRKVVQRVVCGVTGTGCMVFVSFVVRNGAAANHVPTRSE